MESGRVGSFCASTLFLALLPSSAADPAPDCNANPGACDPSVSVQELGPRQVALTVKHSAAMRGFTVAVGYDPSVVLGQVGTLPGEDSGIGWGGIHYFGHATCPTGKELEFVVVLWESSEPGGFPPGETTVFHLLFPGMVQGECSELVLVDCPVQMMDGPIFTSHFLALDGRHLPFRQMVDGNVCKSDAESFFRGDADNNSAIDIFDPIRILEYLFAGGPPLLCLDAADAADSGRISVISAIYLLRWLFQGGPPPPPPGPRCGVDPTLDSLSCVSSFHCP